MTPRRTPDSHDDGLEPASDLYGPDAPGFVAAMSAHQAALDDGRQGYTDPTTGLFVMTAAYLATRPCCGNRCRHCPWER